VKWRMGARNRRIRKKSHLPCSLELLRRHGRN